MVHARYLGNQDSNEPNTKAIDKTKDTTLPLQAAELDVDVWRRELIYYYG